VHPGAKPITHQGDLAKLPRALTLLIERPQWAVWRWTRQANGRWQKPPFQARDPQRHASTKDPGTWSDYATAVAVVQAGDADGISFVLTENDPFAAIDLDHCRDPDTRSFDKWVMNFLDVFRHTYLEVTPSGAGCRIWGLTADNTEPINRKFSLEIDGKPVAAELFRRTPKALTVTGLRLSSVKELANVDRGFGWGIIWGDRRKAQAAEAAAKMFNGHSFNGGGPGHNIEHIDRIVREGAPDGANRSDTFHMVVGHFVGCGLTVEQIYEHLQQFPDGIGSRYLAEGRLSREISRSAGKYNARTLPLLDGWAAKTPQLVKEDPEFEEIEPEPDPGLVGIIPPKPASNPEHKDSSSEPTPDPELEETPPPDPPIPGPELEDTDEPWLIRVLIWRSRRMDRQCAWSTRRGLLGVAANALEASPLSHCGRHRKERMGETRCEAGGPVTEEATGPRSTQPG
jgi:hypothetical protein